MKLINIHTGFSWTSVIVEKSNIEYCVQIDGYDYNKNEVREQRLERKIRNNSKLHEMLCAFAIAKLNELQEVAA
jgi:hypothetical protein